MSMRQAKGTLTDSKVWDVSKSPPCGEIRMKQEREDMGTRIGRAGKISPGLDKGELLGETGQEAPGGGGGV